MIIQVPQIQKTKQTKQNPKTNKQKHTPLAYNLTEELIGADKTCNYKLLLLFPPVIGFYSFKRPIALIKQTVFHICSRNGNFFYYQPHTRYSSGTLAAHFLSIPLDFVVILSTPLGKALIELLLVHIFAIASPVKNLEPRSHEVAPE